MSIASRMKHLKAAVGIELQEAANDNNEQDDYIIKKAKKYKSVEEEDKDFTLEKLNGSTKEEIDLESYAEKTSKLRK